jgi:hypothetical protein
MPNITKRFSIAAGAEVENALAGSQFERMPYNASIAIAIVGDAASHEVSHNVYSGTDVLAENGVTSSANRSPINPEDYTLSDVIGFMEQLKINLRNTGAGAHVVFVSVIITPL